MVSRAARTLLPILLVGLGLLPSAFLTLRAGTTTFEIDATSLRQALVYALSGATVSVIAGSLCALVIGVHDFWGRRAATLLVAVPIAAPPAFWWLGVSRLPGVPWASSVGLFRAIFVSGLALSPIVFLFVLAAIREIPTNAYEAARVSLSPFARLSWILVPLIRSSVLSGFLLTSILLLAESEIPFLFGFRTTMTDIITRFSRTFDASRVAAPGVGLLLVVLVLGVLLSRPLLRTLLTLPRGGRGIARTRSTAAGIFTLGVVGIVLVPLVGYAWTAIGGRGKGSGPSVDTTTMLISICEPAIAALAALLVGVAVAYPLRRSRTTNLLLVAGLLVFCIPSAMNAIGWIGIGQALGGATVSPVAVQVLRLWGVAAMGFATGYARLPKSLEDAARLVAASSLQRAWTFVLPLLAPSLAATALLAAAIIYSDRDVASLLLSPGAERLTLNLYLASANAPAATVGILGLIVFGGALATAFLASAVPFVVLRRRG